MDILKQRMKRLWTTSLMSASFAKLVELGRLWASSIWDGSVENGYSLEVEQLALDKLPSQKEKSFPTIIWVFP